MLYGGADRRSTKVSFMTKVFSSTVDYAMSFELFSFQYDQWLFKTVTGAVSSVRQYNCSLVKALDQKSFSPGYWQWEHPFLMDAVQQYDFPSLSITISPYKWTFSFPQWLNNICTQTGSSPTTLPAYETLHIAHILEQVVRGYLCGSNCNHIHLGLRPCLILQLWCCVLFKFHHIHESTV